jgi:hypothetical protein
METRPTRQQRCVGQQLEGQNQNAETQRIEASFEKKKRKGAMRKKETMGKRVRQGRTVFQKPAGRSSWF